MRFQMSLESNKFKKGYKLIEVEWADHWVNHGDFDYADIVKDAKPMYGKYTGYLVYENKQVVVLCSNVWSEGEVSDPMFIMKKAIVSRSDRS
jgi:hypothetical protein